MFTVRSWYNHMVYGMIHVVIILYLIPLHHDCNNEKHHVLYSTWMVIREHLLLKFRLINYRWRGYIFSIMGLNSSYYNVYGIKEICSKLAVEKKNPRRVEGNKKIVRSEVSALSWTILSSFYPSHYDAFYPSSASFVLHCTDIQVSFQHISPIVTSRTPATLQALTFSFPVPPTLSGKGHSALSLTRFLFLFLTPVNASSSVSRLFHVSPHNISYI